MTTRFVCMGMLLLVILSVPALGQAQKTLVKGLLLDSLTNEGEPFATIRVFRPNKADKPVAMTVTDMDGRFEQEVSGKGDFEILFSSVGKTSKTVPFSLKGDRSVNLDTIYISEDVMNLKGVEIVAQRPLVKMEVDKMSYNTEDDVDSKSSTVLEMLRKVPMVTVDGNDNITVNGSSNFKVYVDGKPNVMMSSNPSAVLKNMPASSVKNIEVITNPGVKYDAEGVGGVLNLVMDKVTGAGAVDLNGYNGTVRGLASTKGFGGGAYFSMQKKRFSMTVNANVAKSMMDDSSVEIRREQFSDRGTGLQTVSSVGDNDFLIKMGNLNLGYELDSLNLLTASFGLMGFDNNSDMGLSSSLRGGAFGEGFSYKGRSDQETDNYSINGSVDYQHTFAANPDRTLTLSYLISSSPTNSDAYSLFEGETGNPYLNLANRYTDARRNTLENTFQADFSTPLKAGQKLNVGLKYIARDNSSDSKYYLEQGGAYVYNEAGSLDYEHTNDILAGYAEYEGKWKNWGFKGGLRYEYTWQHVRFLRGQGEDFSMDYGNLVPSANLSYAIAANQNIGLTYNMRISRPGISFLNPYVDRTDPTSITYGNTDLECEKAHNISLVYNLFTPKWILNLTLRQGICDNAIDSYSFYKENVLNTTYGNIVKNHQTGLNAYVNWNAGPKTRIYMNSGVSYVDLRSERIDLSNTGWQANAMIGAQQTLPWDIRLSLNVITSTKQYNLQGWNSGFSAVMGSVTRSFFKDKLSVGITGMTPLTGSKMEMKSFSCGKDFQNRSTMRIPIQMVGINISYTFGKQQPSVKKVKRAIQNTDVKEMRSQTNEIGTMMVK